jgi:transcriptional regulator with AAA-type ATPase domain
VENLLRRRSPQRAESRVSFLDYPVLSRDITPLAQRAAATRVPVLICGEAGTGKSHLARAIHAASGTGRFVSATAMRFSAEALSEAGRTAPGPMTLYIADIGHLDAEVQHLVIELCDSRGFESAAGWHDVRLVCATDRDISDLAADEVFDCELFYRLSVLPITVLPLRQRLGDIADIVPALARDLGESLPHEPYRFTAEAIDRMGRYMWFGNLAELEAMMLRTMAMAKGPQIGAADLLFNFTRAESSPPPTSKRAEMPRRKAGPTEPRKETVSPGIIATESVDLLVQELAHEFRNPMVTIKTLTQRLEKLLEDKASRDQVARMTGEAVDRMDRALENLLQFTRFGEPISEAVALSPLVTTCLSQLSSAFTERQVLLNYEPPETHFVTVDSAQVSYALENLLRVILRDLRDGDTLSIHPLDGHGITFEFPARGQLVAEKLAVMADSPQIDPSASSIGFLFAKTLVERNGGSIEIHPGTGRTTILVALPGQGEASKENGHAPHSGRR